jgi:hypothetical protein
VKKRQLRMAAAVALLALLALGFAACANPDQGTIVPTHVYAVGSASGNVYQVNDLTQTASSAPLLSTKQNATGELVFYNGIGYLAVASYQNTAPGLYYFNPSTPAAGAVKIGAISASYIAFVSGSLAYVTSVDYNGVYANALYKFNPSNLGAGLTKVQDLSYPQDVAISGGYVYVAENGSGKVARFAADGSSAFVEITTSTSGTTGLLAGTYQGAPGVFVANTGPTDSTTYAYTGGSVDFIANAATAPAAATAIVTGPVAARMGLLGASTLIETGGFPAKTFGITLPSTGSATSVEIKSSGASFGGGDIAVYNGIAYVPDGKNTLYSFSSVSGSVTAISVGKSDDLITNVGIEN